MKGIIHIIVVMLFGLTAFASHAGADSGRSRLFGPDDTFPWGLEQPIPWSGMKGVWFAQGSGGYYYFDTLGPKSDRYMKVIQFRPGSCRILAEGYAYEDERVISGLLASLSDSDVYFRINVHVFAKADLPSTKTKGLDGTRVTVISRSKLNSSAPGETNILVKLGKSPAKFCK